MEPITYSEMWKEHLQQEALLLVKMNDGRDIWVVNDGTRAGRYIDQWLPRDRVLVVTHIVRHDVAKSEVRFDEGIVIGFLPIGKGRVRPVIHDNAHEPALCTRIERLEHEVAVLCQRARLET